VSHLLPQKDPKRRPSAKALLEHRFFLEKAKKPDFLVKTLLEGIPSLGDRVRELREREIARRGGGDDIKSQSQCASWRRCRDAPDPRLCRYVRGVSNWNFNIEDLKAEAEKGGAGPSTVQHKGRFDVYDTSNAGGGGGAEVPLSFLRSQAETLTLLRRRQLCARGDSRLWLL